jgi:NAD(P)-dependent dehydrogenase (short-subunit alcohol dehydrogenase family)
LKLLTGKTALITGGSDGIGFAIATAFAEEGAKLVLVGRDPQKLSQKAANLLPYGIEILSIACDLTNRGAIEKITAKVADDKMRIDILVNNAGVGRFVPFADSDQIILGHHLNLNVKAPYLLTKAFMADLIDARGNVINISSYFAKRMLLDRPSTAYSLTKGALESFTKALAFELGPDGVRVNAIAPGTVATPQVDYNFQRLENAAKNRFRTMIPSIYPLQTIGDPKDIANMAVFLASDLARWVTGGVFPVDGGLTTN